MIEAPVESKKDTFLENLQKGFEEKDINFGSELRNEARNCLTQLEFPTRRTEYWKYTPVNKVVNKSYHFSTEQFDDSEFVNNCLIPGLKQHKLVFVNGFFQPQLSDAVYEQDAIVKSIKEAIEDNDKGIEHLGEYSPYKDKVFTAMNLQYFIDGIFIHIPKNSKVEDPIHIINIVDGNEVFACSHNLIVAEESSEAKFIESFVTTDGTSNTFNNSSTEIFADENAHIEWNKIQDGEDNDNYHVSGEDVYQVNNSIVNTNTYTLDGSLVRNNLNFYVDGENCETHLYGYYMPKNKMLFDNHTIVNHLKPNCESNELYKGVLYDNSTGVFNGRVYVKQHAQKIDAYQSNGNILLGDGTSVNSKPELEIYADDVKCSHGSATGKLDYESLFYLQSRGISERNAKKLLLIAYVAEVLDNLTIEPLKEMLSDKIHKML